MHSKSSKFTYHFVHKKQGIMKCPAFYGRSEKIRTSGLLVPNQALYQAEPHPVLYVALFNALIFYHNLSSLSIVFFQKSRLIGRRGNAYPKKSKKRKNGAQKSCNLSFRVLKYKKKAKENCLSEVLYERRYFGKHNA